MQMRSSFLLSEYLLGNSFVFNSVSWHLVDIWWWVYVIPENIEIHESNKHTKEYDICVWTREADYKS